MKQEIDDFLYLLLDKTTQTYINSFQKDDFIYLLLYKTQIYLYSF